MNRSLVISIVWLGQSNPDPSTSASAKTSSSSYWNKGTWTKVHKFHHLSEKDKNNLLDSLICDVEFAHKIQKDLNEKINKLFID